MSIASVNKEKKAAQKRIKEAFDEMRADFEVWLMESGQYDYDEIAGMTNKQIATIFGDRISEELIKRLKTLVK